MPAKATAKAKATDEKKAKADKKLEAVDVKRRSMYAAVCILIVLATVVAYVIYTVSQSSTFVSFPTFRANLDAAPRIAIVVTYGSLYQQNAEFQCYSPIIQVLSSQRSPSTIDFFVLNSTQCTYQSNGLGHVAPLNATPGSCLKSAGAEPGIYLNYSSSNSTVINAYHMYVYGNANYFAQCPLAVDLK